jgi:glutathione peroxidase-family protein
MTLHDARIAALDGGPLDLAMLHGRAVLVVNVASKCGLTPQYTALEELHERYPDRGFTVLGVPCDQFGGQEPGTAALDPAGKVVQRFRPRTEPTAPEVAAAIEATLPR